MRFKGGTECRNRETKYCFTTGCNLFRNHVNRNDEIEIVLGSESTKNCSITLINSFIKRGKSRYSE